MVVCCVSMEEDFGDIDYEPPDNTPEPPVEEEDKVGEPGQSEKEG